MTPVDLNCDRHAFRPPAALVTLAELGPLLQYPREKILAGSQAGGKVGFTALKVAARRKELAPVS